MASHLFSARKGIIPRIDMMRARREEQTRAFRACRRYLAALGVLCLLSGSALVPLSRRALYLQAQVIETQRAAERELRQAKPDAQKTGNADVRLAQWTRFLKSRSQRLLWCATLHSLVAPIPSEVAVEHIQLAATGDGITAALTGSGENVGAVRAYVSALERGKGLRQPHLTDASADVSFGPEATKFTVSAQAGKAEN